MTELLVQQLGASEQRVCLDAILHLVRKPAVTLAPAALDALVGCLESKRKLVQRRAASALAQIAAHDPKVVPALYRALESGTVRMRWGTAYSLGLIEGALDLRVFPALLEALSNSDGDVRWAAAELVVRLGRKYPLEVRRGLLGLAAGQSADGCKMALYCLRDLKFADEEVCAEAGRACLAATNHVRLAAISLLAHLADGSEQSADILLRCLEEDRHEGVRRAAASALGRLKRSSPRVLEALHRAAQNRNDSSLSRAAQQALARLERI